ncbi:MAG: GNAT family N-acetyltransferase [Thermomicrobiales bacterium]
MTITLRPIRGGDEPFLGRLYASTRQDEMALTGWPPAEIAEFLKAQFDAQHRYYLEHLPPSEFNIIELDGDPIGRLYVGDWEDDVRLIDIALLPDHRNHGIGTRLIEDVMERAASLGKPVRLHVEQNNPARRLYERLDFVALEERGINLFMEWRQSTP